MAMQRELACIVILLGALGSSNLFMVSSSGTLSNTTNLTNNQSMSNNTMLNDTITKGNNFTDTAVLLTNTTDFPSGMTLISNFTNTTVFPSASTAEPIFRNPPWRACSSNLGDQAFASQAKYNIQARTDNVPAIGFGNSTEPFSLTITILNDLNAKQITGTLSFFTPISYVSVPFTMEATSTECFSEAGGPSQLPSIDVDQVVLVNPPFRSCEDNAGFGVAEYMIRASSDLQFLRSNITETRTTFPIPFTITLNNDLIKGGLTGELGYPFSIPLKDLTISTKCISNVDLR